MKYRRDNLTRNQHPLPGNLCSHQGDEYDTDRDNGLPLPPDPLINRDSESDEEIIPTLPASSSQKRRYVEDSDSDDDENGPPGEDLVYILDFPAQFCAGWKKGQFKTQFEILRERQKAEGQDPWSPFPSEDEWALARWLMRSGASQSNIEEFMKLKAVRTSFTDTYHYGLIRIIPKIRGVAPAYKNARGFLKFIDALPPGPKFLCTPLKVQGDLTNANGDNRIETIELWHRDPIECITELLGNPSFRGKQQYAPRQVFRNKDGTNREFGEMWTGDWWWKTQVSEHNIKRMLKRLTLVIGSITYWSNSCPCYHRIGQDPALNI